VKQRYGTPTLPGCSRFFAAELDEEVPDWKVYRATTKQEFENLPAAD
jgi:hypothetical protein